MFEFVEPVRNPGFPETVIRSEGNSLWASPEFCAFINYSTVGENGEHGLYGRREISTAINFSRLRLLAAQGHEEGRISRTKISRVLHSK